MKCISRIAILAAVLSIGLSSCFNKEKCAAYSDVELEQEIELQD